MEDDYIIFYGKKIKKDVTELDLSWNQISDLTPLSVLQNLTELYLHNNQITDLTPLSGLQNLTYLSLDFNRITDLTPLSELHNLTILEIDFNRITDLTPLSGLHNLTVLYLHHNQITDLTPLSGLQNLTRLNLWCNQISDLTPLSGLQNLTRLNLYNNQIICVTPLSGLHNLTILDLGDNQIADLTPLIGLHNLTILDLGRNQICDLTPLIGLHNLTNLHLSGNQIICVTPLSGLHNLTKLYINNNQITLFPLSITNVTRLQEFAYDNHLITNLNNPVISRWLNKPLNSSVYSNRENVHLTSIQTCVHTSVMKLMENWSDVDVPHHEFFDDNTVYHDLGTYKEVYQAVVIEINKLEGDYQITAKQRLQEELEESKSRCYVGRLSRLVNCLSGLSDKVNIQISNNEEISNIVIHFKSQGKERVVTELHERGYTDEEISEWVEHL